MSDRPSGAMCAGLGLAVAATIVPMLPCLAGLLAVTLLWRRS